jgi:hypothetical protein
MNEQQRTTWGSEEDEGDERQEEKVTIGSSAKYALADAA